MPHKVRQQYFLLQVAARGSKNILRNSKYRNDDWKTRSKDRDHGRVRSGDLLLVYFGSNALAYQKHLGLLFQVTKIRDGNREFQLEKVWDFHPIPLAELRSKVDNGVLGSSFLNCGQQGFNICQINRREYEKTLQISTEGHESELKKYLRATKSILATAKKPLSSREIVNRALQARLFDKKDENTVNKVEEVIVQNTQPAGESKKILTFFSVGRGKYALTKWLETRHGEFTIRSLSYWIINSAERSMHYEDVTKAILKIRRLKTDNPSGLVFSTLNSSRKFISYGKGLFGLRKWEKAPRKVRRRVRDDTKFEFGTPDDFASLLYRVQSRFRQSSSLIRISAPYVDVNTFKMFLGKAPKAARIRLLLTADRQLEDKIRKGLTTDLMEHFCSEHLVDIRRIDDLHSRFVVFDDRSCVLCSSDFQREQYSNRFQYAVFSRDSRLVTKVAGYFDRIWKAAQTFDLTSEISKSLVRPTAETGRRQSNTATEGRMAPGHHQADSRPRLGKQPENEKALAEFNRHLDAVKHATEPQTRKNMLDELDPVLRTLCGPAAPRWNSDTRKAINEYLNLISKEITNPEYTILYLSHVDVILHKDDEEGPELVKGLLGEVLDSLYVFHGHFGPEERGWFHLICSLVRLHDFDQHYLTSLIDDATKDEQRMQPLLEAIQHDLRTQVGERSTLYDALVSHLREAMNEAEKKENKQKYDRAWRIYISFTRGAAGF